MKDTLKAIDLQLFAEEEVVEETVEETTETVEETVEETTEEKVEETTEEEKPESVPLSKFMAEKKKRQELERQMLQEKADREAERERLRLKQMYIDQGYPEETAQFHADERVKERQELDKVNSRLMDGDIKDLSQSEPFFADAMNYKEEIKEKMKALNMSAEEAYMSLRGRVRMVEYQTEQEQKAALKRRTVESKTVQNATPTTQKSSYDLDEADRKALEGLKKAQPDFGWTEKKYFELMKRSD